MKKMNQKGKERLALIIWTLFIFLIISLAVQIYSQRSKDIDEGKFTLVSNSECNR